MALWAAALDVAWYVGLSFFWPIALFSLYAAWKFLYHWSRTFFMRLGGHNRWLFSDYSRIYTGFLRVFAVIWVVYLVSTPFRPYSVEAPDPKLLESLRAADPEHAAMVEAVIPPSPYYALSAQVDRRGYNRGILQILENPLSSFLFGADQAAQRHNAESRRAWCIASLCAPPAERAAICEKAIQADMAHPILGRGGFPHLLGHWMITPQRQSNPYLPFYAPPKILTND